MSKFRTLVMSCALALGSLTGMAALAAPAQAVTFGPKVTVLSAGTPTAVLIVTYQTVDNRFVILCREAGNPFSSIGTALTCNYYDLFRAGESARFGTDLRAWTAAPIA